MSKVSHPSCERGSNLDGKAAPGLKAPGAATRTGPEVEATRSMGPMAGSFSRKSAVRPVVDQGHPTIDASRNAKGAAGVTANRRTPRPPGAPSGRGVALHGARSTRKNAYGPSGVTPVVSQVYRCPKLGGLAHGSCPGPGAGKRHAGQVRSTRTNHRRWQLV